MNPSVLNVHTPTGSFAILHSLTEETLDDLHNKLNRKVQNEFGGLHIGSGWLKYEYNDSIWNLDDDSDYAIFTWRQRDTKSSTVDESNVASSSRSTLDGYASASSFASPPPVFSSPPSISSPGPPPVATPTLHLFNPSSPLPPREAYHNPSFYLFHPSRAHLLQALLPQAAGSGDQAPSSQLGAGTSNGVRRAASTKSKNTTKSIGSGLTKGVIVPQQDGTGIPKLRKDFEKFHSENGVRTVVGSIGPVENVRMLLKSTHKHVYISRSFARKHGFIPSDSKPGNYGYAGMISIGEWPVTLQPSRTQQPAAGGEGHAPYTSHQMPGNQGDQLVGRAGQGTGTSNSTIGGHRYKTVAESIAESYVEMDRLPRAPTSPYSASLRQDSGSRAWTGSNSTSSATYKSAISSPVGTKRASSVGAPGNPRLTMTNTGTSSVARSMVSYDPPSSHFAGSGAQSIMSQATAQSTATSKYTYSTKPNQGATKANYAHTAPRNGLKAVLVEVYVSEEPHFDVVLGRTFFEKRSIKINEGDLTDVWCLDTGEKIECEVVILKDGRGEIVTVT
ncbi:hypothetical protein BKA70DRAFT_12675 [Coprinopsis sp. MPI-PUGE-AT-0042]|nr:hypothetical protein BKA70DRAFT_12675 [Coprinopsis sp. MPI-PUGE-AT-0042]